MITVILGTNRPQSNTSIIAGEVLNAYQRCGVEHQLLDLRELPASLFEPGAYAAKPPEFKAFTDMVLGASGLVVVTPEYNGSFPGVLKYFIDMLPFPESFERRPVCLVGLAAGGFGALRPVEQLQMIFSHRNAHIYPQRVFIPGVGDKLDGDGQLADGEIRKRLHAQAEGFAKFAASLGAS